MTEGSLAYVVREAAKYAGNDVEISDLEIGRASNKLWKTNFIRCIWMS